ncbi:MAG TPA: hypothetical protein PKA05_08310 [Roseiflexaceae bacterium]|nr:hypothetical protein [Roseiflexaceae bacterium]HMP40367.1 hypothetical protein [Roseiflexaceae bacterium]
MEELWLGYDGLSVRFADVVAVLRYEPALDQRIRAAYGRVPPTTRAVIVIHDGSYWPARWEIAQIRHRIAAWRDCASRS